MDGLVVGHLIVLSALVASVAANFLLASGFHSDGSRRTEPCQNEVTNQTGQCMFAVDCARSGGRHVAVCLRGVIFGSCCSYGGGETTAEPAGGAPDLLKPIWFHQLARVPILNGNHLGNDLDKEQERQSTASSHVKPSSASNNSMPPRTSSTSVGTTLGTAPTPTPTSTAPQSMTSTSRPRPAVFVVTAVDLHNLNETPSWATTGAPSTTPASVDAITMSPPVGTTTRWTLPPAWTASPDRDADVNVCGKPWYRWPKIVSGTNAHNGQWPWVLSLQERTRGGFIHKCGATLIGRDWAITAAHCVFNVQPENLLLKMGGIDLTRIDERFVDARPSRAVLHPKFSVRTRQHDVALIQLARPIDEWQAHILPICLAEKGMHFDDGDFSFIAGWGRLQEKGPTATKLQYVAVPVVNNTECQRMYNFFPGSIDRTHICAGYPEGIKDACEGDSGGPMMIFRAGRWVLAGVISWGVGCARANQPGVSSRVTEFIDWIEQTTAPSG